ncbi:MAG: dihydroorotate dehydrogenase-like protein [Pirellulales bacterium]|nr:dihydroorotate dehydrogenase-like protein [Pirellulales bacterium]
MSVDLTTKYLSLSLRSPLVASAGPLTGNLSSLYRLEEAGIGAAVMPSLFEEQILHDQMEVQRFYDYQTDANAESLDYFPELKDAFSTPGAYLERIEDAKRRLSIPIIGSLNASSPGGWVDYARRIESAGADALELNIYFVPTDPEMTAADVEARYVNLVAKVRDAIEIPLAVKIGAQFSALPNFAAQLALAGADGLVLFNRYLEPDLDLDRLRIKPELVFSQPHEARVPLRWIAILRDQLPTVSLAATSGVHSAACVAKLLLAGADAVMMTCALLANGPGFAATTIEALRTWMEEQEYKSVGQLRGSMSRENAPDPSGLERANYVQTLAEFTSRHVV